MSEETAVPDENREFAVEPVGKLVAKYSRITMVGMLAQCVMVVIEGLVMGRGLGAHGLACVGIIMSVHYINLAFGNLFGTGVPTVVGNLLGAGDREGARHAFSQGFWITLYVGIVIMLCCELFTRQLVLAFGATPDILEDTIICVRAFGILLPFSVMGQMVTAAMRIDGRPQQSSNIIVAACVIAPLWLVLSTFVFHFGVVGAGVYYGISLGVWAIGLYYFTGGRSQLSISLKDAKLDWAVCGKIVKVGTPYFLVQGGTFVFNTVANNLLGMYGGEEATTWIAVFAVISAFVIYILMMIAQGFAYGMQPIASYNAGAKAWGRLKQIVRYSLMYQIVCVALVTVLVWVFAYPICLFFNAEIAAEAAGATRICIIAACLGYTSMLMSTYFQAVDNIPLSTVLGLSRYVIFSCPLMFFMGGALGIDGMWWALVVADTLTGVLCIGSAVWELKRLTKLEKLQPENDDSISGSLENVAV